MSLKAEIALQFAYFPPSSKHIDEDIIDGLKLFLLNRADFVIIAAARQNGVEYMRSDPDGPGAFDRAIQNPHIPESVLRELLAQPDGSENTRNPARLGCIYLGRSLAHGFIKIGWAVSPSARERTLQAEDPQYRVFFASLPKFTIKDERQLHECYSRARRRGEWFDLSDEQIQEIKTFLSQ